MKKLLYALAIVGLMSATATAQTFDFGCIRPYDTYEEIIEAGDGDSLTYDSRLEYRAEIDYTGLEGYVTVKHIFFTAPYSYTIEFAILTHSPDVLGYLNVLNSLNRVIHSANLDTSDGSKIEDAIDAAMAAILLDVAE